MYLALDGYGKLSSAGRFVPGEAAVHGTDEPLGRIALPLGLGEDTVGFVVDAGRASRKLAVTLDLLLPTHIAGLSEGGKAVSDRDLHVLRQTAMAEN